MSGPNYEDDIQAYYDNVAAQENGDTQFNQAMTYSAPRMNPQAFPAQQRRSTARDKYWSNNAPVFEKVDHNGQTVLLPVIAPISEKITVKKPIFEQTITVIREQQSHKATWAWKVGILDERFRAEVPSSKALTMNALGALKIRTTANVYTFRDVRIHGNMVNTDLNITTAPNTIDPASVAACRWISMTMGFNPRLVNPTNVDILPAELPSEAQIRIYFSAPLDPAGGLHASITHAHLTNNPAGIFGLYPTITFSALKAGTIPLRDTFDDWMLVQLYRAYYEGMVQIIQAVYVGAGAAQETLGQRFKKLTQRDWDPISRKSSYCSVRAFQQRVLTLLAETQGMDDATIEANVPELDKLFYDGLSSDLQTSRVLLNLTIHPPSQNLGQNTHRLQLMVTEAVNEETNLARISTVASRSVGGYRRTQVGTNPTNSSTASTFAALPAENEVAMAISGMRTQETAHATTGLVPFAPSEGTVDDQPQAKRNKDNDESFRPIAFTFAMTFLSSVERALRDSSGTNAPMQCWGCKGIYDDDAHIFRECPHKQEQRVLDNFRVHLDEYMKNKRKGFDPNRYRRDGFQSKRAATLFNMILSDDQTQAQRTEAIRSFVGEFNLHNNERPRRFTINSNPANQVDGPETIRGGGNSQYRPEGNVFHCFTVPWNSDDTRLDISLDTPSGNIFHFGPIQDDPIQQDDSVEQLEGPLNALTLDTAVNTNEDTLTGHVFPFWVVPGNEHSMDRLDTSFNEPVTYNTSITEPIRFPISTELPHLFLPVGKQKEAHIEGLLDSGGACNMGDLTYWKDVITRHPELLANLYELTEHRIEPISIGGIGAGRIEITHIAEIWLPWRINGLPSKFVIGLGDKMPLTLLIGMPFFIAAKVLVNIDNMTCFSKVFNTTWQLVLKTPSRRSARTLDQAESSAGRLVLTTTAVSPSPQRNRTEDVYGVRRVAFHE